MNCPHCNALIPDGVHICPSCGKQVFKKRKCRFYPVGTTGCLLTGISVFLPWLTAEKLVFEHGTRLSWMPFPHTLGIFILAFSIAAILFYGLGFRLFGFLSSLGAAAPSLTNLLLSMGKTGGSLHYGAGIFIALAGSVLILSAFFTDGFVGRKLKQVILKPARDSSRNK